MPELVAVELLARVHHPSGGSWNRGETAGFAPDEAARLVRQGLARPVKAPEAPPADRMVKGPPIKKGL